MANNMKPYHEMRAYTDTQVAGVNASKSDLTNLAPAYTAAGAAVGDYRTYLGVLYRCITATSGAWNAAHWVEAPVGTDLTDINAAIARFLDYVSVADNGSDVYPIDMASHRYVKVAITTADADAKGVTVSNVPSGSSEIFMKLLYTNAAAITWTMKAGSTTSWLSGAAPSLTSGKTYRLSFFTDDGGATWQGTCVGGW